MSATPKGCLIPEITHQPTAVMLYGESESLLNWLLYAILVRGNPQFRWTDVREKGAALDPLDPLAQGIVPASQLNVVEPEQLTPHQRVPSPTPDMIRDEESSEGVRRLTDFMRLPTRTQEFIARTTAPGRLALVGLSNAQRLLPRFNPESIQSTIRSFLEAGASLILTMAGSIPAGRVYQFEIRVDGKNPRRWKEATFRCTLGDSVGPVRAGRSMRFGDIPEVAEVLGPLLPA